jgi:hypothetical protein
MAGAHSSACYSGFLEVAAQILLQADAVHAGWLREELGSEADGLRKRVAVPGRGSAELRVAPIPVSGALFVDGQARAEQPVVLVPKEHLMEAATGQQVVLARMVDLGAGRAAEVATGLVAPEEPQRCVSPWLLAGGAVAVVAAAPPRPGRPPWTTSSG